MVRVHTRFPPEPNGYLHIGHAKSICLNFGLAQTFGGKCNLRFDDTNPETEETLFVKSIEEDVRWLGFEWDKQTYYASDYFEQLYEFAVRLIEKGKAYVDSRSLDEIRATRGDFYKPGQDSPYRSRSIAENLDLFRRMRAGEFPDGAHVLRAKIDMVSPDVKLRDPLMYRIRRAHHHRTGDAWCIYPMYDWAHGQSDAIEGITHSICTLEFANHRPLYHFFLDALEVPHHPQQIEFARLNLTYTVLSKRKLQELVAGHHVTGWDDPRMPTLAGLRRRGYTKEAIRAFCERVGVSTRDSVVDVSLLEHALREDLNARSPRVMAVLRPVKVVIENMAEGAEEVFDAPYDPEKPDGPSRKVYLSREILDRARGLRRGAAQEVVPARARSGGEAALRVPAQVHRGRQGRARRGSGAPVHLGPGLARRVVARRPQGQGDHPLGEREARGPRGGQALRSTVQRREPAQGQGHRLHGAPQPVVARGPARLPAGAQPRGREAVRPGAVRAPRLLRRRPRLSTWPTRLEPHHRPARLLGRARRKDRRDLAP